MERSTAIAPSGTRYSLAAVAGASLLFSLLYCPLYDTLVNDVEVFRHMGLAISKGYVPYRDFFDHNRRSSIS